MPETQNRLPATKANRPSPASLVFITLAAAAALLSWPVVIGLALSTRTDIGETRVLALAAFATTVSLGTLALAMRFLIRDAHRRDHVALFEEREATRAAFMAELRKMRDEITARGDDTTGELDARLVAIIAQNAKAHARLAAMSEQISEKLDLMWWGAYTGAAHDLGYAVDGTGVVVDIRGKLGERAELRLRGRDGA